MILKTKYFDIETDLFSFKNPEQIRKRIENSFKNCFTDKPSIDLVYDGPFKISFKYEPTKDYFSTPFPVEPEDLIFLNIGCVDGYKIMNDDYTCHGFHYEHNHSYSIDKDIIPCKRGFHFCKELTDCFYYYRPTAHGDMAHNITYDLDVFKFLRVKSNGTTYKLRDKYCTNSITIREECTTEEILEAFKKHFNELLFNPNQFKIKLRDEFYEYHDGVFHKVITGDKLSNQLTWTFYIPEED